MTRSPAIAAVLVLLVTAGTACDDGSTGAADAGDAGDAGDAQPLDTSAVLDTSAEELDTSAELAPAPLLATPARVEFEVVPKTVEITLENTSDAPVAIHDVTVTGYDFTVDRARLPSRLAPDERGTISVEGTGCATRGFVVISYGDAGRALQIPLLRDLRDADRVIIRAYLPVGPDTVVRVPDDTVLLARRPLELRAGVSCFPTDGVSASWRVEAPSGAITTTRAPLGYPWSGGFTPDAAGIWRAVLTVTGPAGERIEGARAFTVVDPTDLEVELTWATPPPPEEPASYCLGPDLDVHLAREAADGAPGWGEAELDGSRTQFSDVPFRGTPDDVAALTTGDDRYGPGPETIRLVAPRPERYHLGASFYRDNGFTVALATVRVRVRGEVIRTCGPTPMVAGDLWEVATFDGGAEALSPGCGVVTRGFFEGISGCHPQVGF